MEISIIQPSRNNLVYLQWAYKAIRKNQGKHTVQICVADDFSNDGTWEWCCDVKRRDPNFDCIRNDGPTRLGHTILYDRLVNEVAKYDVCMIYHADMYLCPGALDAIETLMYDLETTKEDTHKHLNIVERRKRIVSLTRIEPPLHPSGPEKLVFNFGVEPDNFDENKLLEAVRHFKLNPAMNTKTTEGVFAPWAFWKSDFQEIGGHDPLFAPQSKEDSDIFNRFQLNGVEFIQTWQGFVYHMTCRGSRFNPTLTSVGKNSTEWEQQNQRSARNFIRKWGHFVKHDPLMKPIIPHKYDIGISISNCTYDLLYAVEPWASKIYLTGGDMPGNKESHGSVYDSLRDDYIAKNQPDTLYNLGDKICVNDWEVNDVLIKIDGRTFNQIDMDSLVSVSEILSDSGAVGTFNLGNMVFHIKQLVPKEMELIRVNK